ncbi:MAG: hypothetical protein QOE41_2553, partial [Mycobacterium sp.]|nr:hypothetical protein [Mycobacterium sp.]
MKKPESVSQIGDMCREVLQIANHINATTSNAASDYDTICPTQQLSGNRVRLPSASSDVVVATTPPSISGRSRRATSVWRILAAALVS